MGSGDREYYIEGEVEESGRGLIYDLSLSVTGDLRKATKIIGQNSKLPARD
jgi:hypothetical protein